MAQYTPEQLEQMPIEQLEQLIMQEAANLNQVMPAEGQPLPGDEAPPPDMVAVDPYMDTGVPLDMMSADIIQQATTKLVEAGFLDLATAELTPELIQVFQAVSDQLAPGIYDLNDDADLMEFINGIANGTITVPGTRELTAAASSAPAAPPIPDPTGAGIPSESPEPGGIPAF